MKDFKNQLVPLLKKNYLLKGKSKIKLVGEILSPMIVIGILYGLLYLTFIMTPDYSEQYVTGFTEIIANTKQLIVGSEGGLNDYQNQILGNLKKQVFIAHPEVSAEMVERYFVVVDNIEAMDAYYHNPENYRGVMGGVWFPPNQPNNPTTVKYSIKVDSDWVNDNNKQYKERSDSQIYLRHYFSQIQSGVDQAILMTNGFNQPILITAQRFPGFVELWKKWTDGRKMIFQEVGGIFITTAIFVGYFNMITNLVIEKETKIFENMKIMGLNSLAFYCSLSITSLYTVLPSTILIMLSLKLTGLIHSCQWFILLIVLVLYSITLLQLSFILSKFFSRSKFAGMVSFLIVLVFGGVGILISRFEFSTTLKLLTALISPIALAMANYSWVSKDLELVYAIKPNWSFIVSEYQVIGFLAFDILLYTVIIWYLDNVVPGEFGISKPWYFLITKSYWCGGSNKLKNSSLFDLESILCNRSLGDGKNFENFKDSKNEASIVIRNLRKEYQTGDGKRVALDDFSIDIRKETIHAILGQNGAGKSTLFSVCVGLIECTSGGAIINGMDIHKDMNKIRKSLGFCSQNDVIWPQLTVLEHLQFYASLKGYSNKNGLSKIEAIKIAIDVGLEQKLNSPASTLSGGQKRKLCLGIAFIGPRCDIIFLDEVSSGLDPTSRKEVWDFILNHKQGKTIILSTHYIDEAEAISNCISIMSYGQLKCNGSSLFLKNRFGVGYLLTITKKSLMTMIDTNVITNTIIQFISDATLLSDAGMELQYRLPTGSLGKFSEFFKHLDENMDALKLTNYGISVTTIEEVFLKIISDVENSKFGLQDFEESIVKKALLTTSTGTRSGQQLKGLLIKRAKTTRKDLKSFLLSIFIPLLILTGGLILYKNMRTINIYNTVTTPLLLDINVFQGENFTIPFSIKDVNSTFGLSFKNALGQTNHAKIIEYDQFNDYLLENYQNTPGAFYFDKRPIDPSVEGSPEVLHYNVYYNKNYLHVLPIYVNFINSEISKYMFGPKIETTSLPFEHIKSNFEKSTIDINFAAIIFFIILTLASFSLISASHAANITMERSQRVKRLLYISGLKKYCYWISNLIWDYFLTALLVVFLSVLVVSIDDKFRNQFHLFIVTIILFTIAIIPLSYLMSYAFKSHGKAVGAIFGIHFVTVSLMTVCTLILRIWAIKENSESFQTLTDIADIVFFALSPFYCFSKVLTIITNFPGTTRVGETHISNYWSIHFGLLPILVLIVHCIVWVTWILLIDYSAELNGKFRKRSIRNKHAPLPPDNEDSDVANERIRVNKLLSTYKIGSAESKEHIKNDNPIIISGLSKTFEKVGKNKIDVIAVNNTSLVVGKGTTLALLGVNGAGKSTTLEMISGDCTPTAGEIKINGYDLQSQRLNALRSIGYCFQFDALIGLLSAREQLTLYCRIKGIPENEIPETVESFIKMMDLSKIAKSNVNGYSGGNKRKVSLSICLLGNPSVVLLDEPSNGVDVCVKKHMWNVITLLKKNKSIILTSHHLAEVEALSNVISIQKDGKLLCHGSIQNIKNKFGGGYSIEVKFKKEYEDTGVELFKGQFKTSSLIQHQHGLSASFEIPNSSINPIKLSFIFSTIESNLKSIIDDYMVSQSTIEQIFLKLTSKQYYPN